jgi:hypothetical protein
MLLVWQNLNSYIHENKADIVDRWIAFIINFKGIIPRFNLLAMNESPINEINKDLLSLIYFAIDQNFICILVCLDLNEKI